MRPLRPSPHPLPPPSPPSVPPPPSLPSSVSPSPAPSLLPSPRPAGGTAARLRPARPARPARKVGPARTMWWRASRCCTSCRPGRRTRRGPPPASSTGSSSGPRPRRRDVTRLRPGRPKSLGRERRGRGGGRLGCNVTSGQWGALFDHWSDYDSAAGTAGPRPLGPCAQGWQAGAARRCGTCPSQPPSPPLPGWVGGD